jgi:RNA-directed DNA polymerase
MGLLSELFRRLVGGSPEPTSPARKPTPASVPPPSVPPQPLAPPRASGGSVVPPPPADLAPLVRRQDVPPALAERVSPAPAPRPPTAPVRETIDLDLGPFAPISQTDLRAAAGKLTNAFSNLWLFGRSNRIPPAADPRTNLIDRAMVTQGLLSPQELAEIHAVGEAYDAARPDLQRELAKAQVAVVATDAERAARKARKKAEAAERDRLRAEAVAHRRATDIVFLGRGVSTRLHDRTSDEAKLAALGLPLLSTPADVAAAMGLTVPRLRWLAFHSEVATVSHYVRFQVPKKSGGVRQLAAPHKSLAAAQEWVLANVLGKVPTHDAAHGFVPGRSTVTNAAAHVGKAVVVNADLSDFFPTITFPRARGVFKQLGYSPAVATVLALLCTESPRRTVVYAGNRFHVATGPRALPQGACTSPALSNLAARRLDSRLAGIARALGFAYTRYADDLTFSGGRGGTRTAPSPGTPGEGWGGGGSRGGAGTTNDANRANSPLLDPPPAYRGREEDAASSSDEARDNDPTTKVGYLLARVRHVAGDEGFAVNEKKTRVLRPSAAQTVTGIVVNDRPGVPRDVVRRLRAILHRAKFEGLPAQNRENHPHFEAWVRGMVAYVGMVNPDQARPLRAVLDVLPKPEN